MNWWIAPSADNEIIGFTELLTLISVCTFSILFPIHFQMHIQITNLCIWYSVSLDHIFFQHKPLFTQNLSSPGLLQTFLELHNWILPIAVMTITYSRCLFAWRTYKINTTVVELKKRACKNPGFFKLASVSSHINVDCREIRLPRFLIRFNQGQPIKYPVIDRMEGLDPRTIRLQTQHPNHLATLPN